MPQPACTIAVHFAAIQALLQICQHSIDGRQPYKGECRKSGRLPCCSMQQLEAACRDACTVAKTVCRLQTRFHGLAVLRLSFNVVAAKLLVQQSALPSAEKRPRRRQRRQHGRWAKTWRSRRCSSSARRASSGHRQSSGTQSAPPPLCCSVCWPTAAQRWLQQPLSCCSTQWLKHSVN